jgi:hypothetical protein
LAAWRVKGHLERDKGDLWTRAANYHSRTPAFNARYRAVMIKKAGKWARWISARFKTYEVEQHAEVTTESSVFRH